MKSKGMLLAIVGWALVAAPGAHAANGPEVGANVGAMVPLSKFKDTVGGGAGATVGFYGGYRWDLTEALKISLIGQPQFTFAPGTEVTRNGATYGGGFGSMVIFTAGPKLTFQSGPVETYVSTQGGYYHDLTGMNDDTGGGFNAGGGVNYRLNDLTSVGLFGRYDYTTMNAAPWTTNTRQFVLAGIGVNHTFPVPQVAVAAPPPPVKRKIILRGVHFDFDKSNIRSDARPILDAAIATLKDDPNVRVAVEGYTDSTGSEEYNLGLSQRRAQAVVDYLVDGGIARSRLESKGMGESDPVASNDTEDGRAQNRRVELRVLGQ